LIERSCSLYRKRVIFKEQLRGRVVSYTAQDLYDDVFALGTALIDLGLRGKKIAVIGENSYSWINSYLSIICGVGIVVPLDKELTKSDIGHLLDASDASAVLCSRTYLPDIEDQFRDLKKLEHIIIIDTAEHDGGYCCLPKLIERGKRLIAAGNRDYFDSIVDPDACAAILFTSGTTGANKGVMLSHRNIAANVNSIIEITPIEPPSFSILPFNHCFEFNCEILTGIYLGAEVYICSSLKRVLSDMKMIQPRMTIAVPFFLDTIYSNIWSSAKKSGKADTLRKAVKFSNILLKIGIDIRHKLFKDVRNALGGNFELVVCGGAAADPNVISGLNELGIDVLFGYGITECAPLVSLNSNTRRNPKSVGPAIPGVEIKIDEPDAEGSGEILVRGNNVMLGYYKDDEATAASFTDGWFRTGDFGTLDKHGELIITGRKKNIIILDNGKNVHPEEIEQKLIREIPYVKEVVIYSGVKLQRDKQVNIIAAALHIDLDSAFPDMVPEEIERAVAEDMRRFNYTLPTYKKIQDYTITNEDFVKTTTMKVIRHEVINELINTK